MALGVVAAGCGRSAPPSATTTLTATGPATVTAPVSSTATARVVAVPLPPHREDAGAGACLLLRGPIELPIRGAMALRVRGDALDAVLNDNGSPRVVSEPIGAVSFASSTGPELNPGPVIAGLAVPCALAGDQTYCPDRAGAIHRADADGTGDPIVASSRVGSRIAAASLGTGHSALAYLASRMTSEGWVSEAWLAIDGRPPVRLSEEGSGATSVVLQARGPSLLALLVDARAALTAMHIRPIGYDGAVQMGEDVVIFVGGPGDRRTMPALAVPPAGPGWALLPIGKDLADFGLAVVRLDVPPHVDEPVVWSPYPNGLDPAPIAVAAAAGGGDRKAGRKLEPNATGSRTEMTAARAPAWWIARVRPETADPSALRELELGEVQEDGTFLPHESVATSARMSDVALADDGRGALWIGWTDGSASWIERLVCR